MSQDLNDPSLATCLTQAGSVAIGNERLPARQRAWHLGWLRWNPVAVWRAWRRRARELRELRYLLEDAPSHIMEDVGLSRDVVKQEIQSLRARVWF